MDTSRTFARRLYLLERQLFNVSTQLRLGFSSIEGGYIDGYDDDGNPTVIVGELPDGGTGTEPLGGPPPPKPTGFAFEGGIRSFVANWAGTFEGDVPAPMNLARIEVHIGTNPTFIPDLIGPTGGASSTMKGTIETPRGGGLVIGGFDPPGGNPANYPDYFAVLVARSTSGKYSEPSDVIGPVKPVSIAKIELENFTVTSEDIANLAITAEKVYPGAIVAGKIGANAILAVNIQADQINTAHLQANAITADKIAANAVTADKIYANSITADKLAVNSVTAGAIAAGAVTANKIAAGAIDGITITGSFIQTDYSGRRVVMDNANDRLTFYSSDSAQRGFLQGATAVEAVLGTAGLEMRYSSNGGSVAVTPIGVGIDGPLFAAGGWIVEGTGKQVVSNSPVDIYAAMTANKVFVNTPGSGSGIPNTRFVSGSSGGQLIYTDHANSSRRFKKMIHDLDLDPEVAYAVRPVEFQWREAFRSPDRPRGYVDMGFIAEELQALGLDRWLGFDDKGLPSEVDYAKMSVVNQVAIRDLHRRVLELEAARS